MSSCTIDLDDTFQVAVVVELFCLDFTVQIAQWGIHGAVIDATPNFAGYVDTFCRSAIPGNSLCFGATKRLQFLSIWADILNFKPRAHNLRLRTDWHDQFQGYLPDRVQQLQRLVFLV